MRQKTGKRVMIPGTAATSGGDSLVQELEALVARLRAITETIDAAIARESIAGEDEAPAGIVVLDDLTPRYLQANGALKACNAHLGGALHFLRRLFMARSRKFSYS